MNLTIFDETKHLTLFREECRAEGENLLADAIVRIRNGETEQQLIASGVKEHTAHLACTLR